MKYFWKIIFLILVLIYLVLFCNISNLEKRFKYFNSYKHITNKSLSHSILRSCKSGKAIILAYVMIRVDSFEKRILIRRTWANSTLFPKMNTVFVMGLSTNKSINERVRKENQQFNDIIQGSFIDAYRNLTHKSLIAWKWILEKCNLAKYVVKIDDDIALNSVHLIEYFNSNPTFNRTFFCDVYYGGFPHKDKSSKWYVRDEEYENVYNRTDYPTFCLGPAYIMTADLVEQLYKKSFNLTLFWLEDIYTALLASRINNVTFIQFNSRYTSKSDVANRKDHVLIRDMQSANDFDNILKHIISK